MTFEKAMQESALGTGSNSDTAADVTNLVSPNFINRAVDGFWQVSNNQKKRKKKKSKKKKSDEVL